uniref:Uncharacterized protein n=1 Tax=Rhizophora mucronata TaxID=61149 RepID=A0A2P2IHP6_RHIMU
MFFSYPSLPSSNLHLSFKAPLANEKFFLIETREIGMFLSYSCKLYVSPNGPNKKRTMSFSFFLRINLTDTW